METNEIFESLKAFFAPEDIEWRVGSTDAQKTRGMALAYLDARAVMDRLDEVMGPANWRNEYKPGPNGGVICGISLRIDGEWITKWDGADNTAVEPVKGGISDSFKRAAVVWGIGRYLYEFPAVWVKIEAVGKSTKMLEKPSIPAQFLPKGYKPKKATTQQPLPEPAAASEPAVPAEKPAAKPAAKPAVAGTDDALKRAMGYVIPQELGLPFGDKTLGEAIADPVLGKGVVSYLAGLGVSRSTKKPFTPANDEQTRLQNAAKFVLENAPA